MQKLLKHINGANIATFLLFFVLATMIWYGHAMQSVRNTRVPVHICYTGKPDNIGLDEEGLPDEVMIEVRDAGHRLDTYHRNSLQITIDLHPYIHGEKGVIQIPANDLRSSIKAILQDNSNLIETVPEEIRCPYFTEQEKTVVLCFNGDIQTANGYQTVGVPTLSQSHIKIFGKAKDLRTIDTLYTEHVVFDNLSDTLRKPIAIAIPKGIRPETDSTVVQIITEQFTEKKFALKLIVKNAPENYRIRLFPDEVEVSVRVGVSHFAQVKASDINVSCTYNPERKDKLDVELDYSANSHITSAWVYPGEVEYLLEQ